MRVVVFLIAFFLFHLTYACDENVCQTSVSVGSGFMKLLGKGACYAKKKFLPVASAAAGTAAAGAVTAASSGVGAVFAVPIGAAVTSGIKAVAGLLEDQLGGCGDTSGKACSECGSGSNAENALDNMDSILESLKRGELDRNEHFQKLNEEMKKIIEQHAQLLDNQKILKVELDQIMTKTFELEASIEMGTLVTLYGDDIQRLKNAIVYFKELNTNNLGEVTMDYRWNTFYSAVTDHEFEGSMNNVFNLLNGEDIWLHKSLWTVGGMCTEETKLYFISLLTNCQQVKSVVLASQGMKIDAREIESFKTQIIRSIGKFHSDCKCKTREEPLLKQRQDLHKLLNLTSPNPDQNFLHQVMFHTTYSRDIQLMQKLTLLFETRPFQLSDEAAEVVAEHPIEDFHLIEKLDNFGMLEDLTLYEGQHFCASDLQCSTKCEHPPLLLNGQPLPLVVNASSSVRVTRGGGRQNTIKVFAIGGGGGGGNGGGGGGGSGYIATGRLTVTDGTVLDVEIGQGGGLYEDGGATKVVGHVVARGGKGSGGVGGSGWSGGGGAGIGSPGDGGNSGGDGQAGRGSSWAEAGGSGEGDQLPDINTSSGRMVAGSGGRGKPYYGGGGGGVLMQDNKHSSWAENDGEGYGAGGGGDNSGKNGLVIFY